MNEANVKQVAAVWLDKQGVLPAIGNGEKLCIQNNAIVKNLRCKNSIRHS
jgi:hypothetical protein